MADDKKKNTNSFKLEIPNDGSATNRSTNLSPDHDDRERDLGQSISDEPDALYSGAHDLRKDSLEEELRHQIDQLHNQVKDISNLRGGDQLTDGQSEILRKYLALKESEVRDLREQHQQYQSFIGRVSNELEKSNLRIRELLTDMETSRAQEEQIRRENRSLRSAHEEEILRIKSEYEERLKKSGDYESQVDDLIKRRDQWRERVKEELKRIKLKERELENRYELLKRDMQALLDSKDRHALELKKKNDALELEMESLEEKLLLSSRKLGSVESKKRRLIETMKLCLGLLETIDQDDASLPSSDDGSPSSGSRKAG